MLVRSETRDEKLVVRVLMLLDFSWPQSLSHSLALAFTLELCKSFYDQIFSRWLHLRVERFWWPSEINQESGKVQYLPWCCWDFFQVHPLHNKKHRSQDHSESHFQAIGYAWFAWWPLEENQVLRARHFNVAIMSIVLLICDTSQLWSWLDWVGLRALHCMPTCFLPSRRSAL